jgi:integrase
MSNPVPLPELRKKRGTYRFTLTNTKGRRREIDTGQTTKPEAIAVIRESAAPELMAVAKAAGRVTSDVVSQLTAGRKITMAKALPEFVRWIRSNSTSVSTLHNCTVTINAMIERLNVASVSPMFVTEEQIDSYVNDGSNAKMGTLVDRLSIIRKFFKFCTAKGYCFANPATIVNVRMDRLTQAQREPTKRFPFTEEEVDTMRADLRGFWKTAMIIGLHTGLRLGDVCCLEWSSVGEKALTVWTDKRDRRVELPLNPSELRKAIASIPYEDKRYCFPSMANMVTDKSGTAKASCYFVRHIKRMGIEGKSFHCLRHTYATNCRAEGVEMPHISKNMGHQSEWTTRGYVHE